MVGLKPVWHIQVGRWAKVNEHAETQIHQVALQLTERLRHRRLARLRRSIGARLGSLNIRDANQRKGHAHNDYRITALVYHGFTGCGFQKTYSSRSA
jgi:hypothetical protein